jgi:DNA-binding transcriptional ArsR family regulator
MPTRIIEKNSHEIAGILKMMSNIHRLKILCCLYQEERSPSELAQVTGLSQSATSQHISLIRGLGVIRARRDAQTIHYSLSDTAVIALLETLNCAINVRERMLPSAVS